MPSSTRKSPSSSLHRRPRSRPSAQPDQTEPIPDSATFLAGKSFLAYGRRGGTRTAPLPDFFIGALAATAGYRLLTRDAARYRTYYPRLALIAPN